MINANQIKTIVRRYQFDAVGITYPALSEKYYRAFEKWLENGYHGGMEWLLGVREERRDIRTKYPWANSVLVVLENYAGETVTARNGLQYSQYAVGQDYHKVIKNKLQKVLSDIRDIAGNIKGKIFVDSGPILEKAFAEQAGLGWIGKNGVLIGKDMGSFCFIGVLLLSIELEPDKPCRNLCGDCRKCIDACPNAAIIEPGLLDCERCISYLTVEKRGDFRSDEAALIHNWVYGCDICQNVCPWNEKWATKCYHQCYHLYQNEIRDYIGFEKKTNVDIFKRVFENTPAGRIGFEQMKRNIDAALKIYKQREKHE